MGSPPRSTQEGTAQRRTDDAIQPSRGRYVEGPCRRLEHRGPHTTLFGVGSARVMPTHSRRRV
jgi:hypothetical protein